MRRFLAVILLTFVQGVSARYALTAQVDFDWSTKWHGQHFAVRTISGGNTRHFTEKYNRIDEVPWSGIQILLGAYMVGRVEEARQTLGAGQFDEELTAIQCRGVMSFLSSAQQLYEGHVVYQLDDWQPTADWAQSIWKQESLAHAILLIDEARQSKIESRLGMIRVPLVVPRYPGQVFTQGTERKPPSTISWQEPKKVGEVSTLLAEARAFLNEDENAEVNRIIDGFDRALANAGKTKVGN